MAVAGCSVGRPRERYATKQITQSANNFKTSEDAGRWVFVLMNSTLRKSACWTASGHNSKLLSMIQSADGRRLCAEQDTSSEGCCFSAPVDHTSLVSPAHNGATTASAIRTAAGQRNRFMASPPSTDS